MPSKIPTEALSLSRFLLRRQTLQLYRDFMRLIKGTENDTNKKELIQWVRHEFRSNMNHTDEKVIKMHLSRGRTAYKEIETMIHLSK